MVRGKEIIKKKGKKGMRKRNRGMRKRKKYIEKRCEKEKCEETNN